ncbi:MAG: hypothetical protein ACO394_02105 [Blastocatellia bacterium]
MYTFKTKHSTMLTVVLAILALSGNALAQQTTQNAHTMFFGEGVTKINMVEYKGEPVPVPLGGGTTGTLGGTNPTWVVSPFAALLSTAAGTSNVHDIANKDYRLSTLGKSSLKGQTLSFEIVAGAIDRCSAAGTPVASTGQTPNVPCTAAGRNGEVNHTGGFTITRGGYAPQAAVSPVTGNYQRTQVRRVQVVSLTLDFNAGVISGLVSASDDWAELHTGTVLGRLNIFNLPGITQNLHEGAVYSGTSLSGTGARSSRFDTLWVQDLKITLHPDIAGTLNTFFGSAGYFTDDMHVGYANFFAVGVPARELPDYRDWVFRY